MELFVKMLATMPISFLIYSMLSIYYAHANLNSKVLTIHSDLRKLLRQGMHNGPPYPRPDNFGGYNMAPPHSVPNPHNLGPSPIGTSVRPPSSMFAPPDFPSVSSADAYRQHHEVTAMVRS